jgi:tRNA A-37 threonylcarbamoyl transferase component Bud32
MSIRTAQQLGKQLTELRLISEPQLAETLAQLTDRSADSLLRHLEGQMLLTPFQIAKLVKGETTGFYVGRFKILYRNASGTFARVFRAVDPSTDDIVAVKLLRDRHTLDTETVRQFQREAELTASLRHPNIVRVLDVGIDPETKKPFIAMEFVEGGNLRELLRSRGRFQPHEVVRLGREMIEGLNYALSRNITHRDLKPTNVLISADGRVKLVDFGLAGVIEHDRNSRRYVAEQRTVDYAGLEMATGAPKGDPRSDIFFLGALFYHMLTGIPALFESSDKKQRMLRMRFDRVPRLEGTSVGPADLGRIVDRMLAFRPENRYQDYDALIRDLDGVRLTAPSGNGGNWENGAQENGQAAPADATHSEWSRRVVVVHRSHRVQELLRDTLCQYGYQIVVTADIHRALSLLELKPAACVIIDVESIGRAGVETYERQLRRRGVASKAAAIFLCATDQVDWVDGCLGPRVAILERPIKLGAIYRALRAFVPRPKKLDA